MVIVPSTNKHADRLRGGLDGGSNAHNASTNKYSGATSETIGEVRCKGISCKGADVLEGTSIRIESEAK